MAFRVLTLPIRNGQEDRHDRSRHQLQILGIHLQKRQHSLDDHIVDNSAKAHRQQLESKILEKMRKYFNE